MSLVVVGSMAFDAIETPLENQIKLLVVPELISHGALPTLQNQSNRFQ
ncbi:MAG: hypothetical protein WKG06_43800 [Segetibacter sp.]